MGLGIAGLWFSVYLGLGSSELRILGFGFRAYLGSKNPIAFGVIPYNYRIITYYSEGLGATGRGCHGNIVRACNVYTLCLALSHSIFWDCLLLCILRSEKDLSSGFWAAALENFIVQAVLMRVGATLDFLALSREWGNGSL